MWESWEAARARGRRWPLVVGVVAAVVVVGWVARSGVDTGEDSSLRVQHDVPGGNAATATPPEELPVWTDLEEVRGDWTRLDDAPIALPREHLGVWTGAELVVGFQPEVAAYDPAAGRWRQQLPSVPGPVRADPRVAWTGDQVQQTVADITAKFSQMLTSYQDQNLWPINAPLEIRVTGLDDPSKVGTASAQSPVISALSVDPVVQEHGWDVAVWVDVLTLMPDGRDTQKAYQFYEELEAWIYAHFADGFRVCPEWSKGWAYTAEEGAWANSAVIDVVRRTFTDGRSADDSWSREQQTLASYDSGGLFLNTFLDQLLGP